MDGKMAIRLNELVEGGVLFNRRRNSVHGQLYLRDTREPVTLELTGNPEADLMGRSFEFTMPETDRVPSEEEHEIIRAMEPRQIGPVGEITASRKMRIAALPAADAASPETRDAAATWQYCLYIEWFGQNGRVVAELPGARIRLLDVDVPEMDGAFAEREGEEPPADPAMEEDGDPEEGHDPYNLFDEDFDAKLGEEYGDGEDEGIFTASEEEEALIDNLERMDAQMESGDTMPMRELLEEEAVLPDPEELDEESAAALLKTLLAKLALFGIAFDMCEHSNARDAYRILLEEVVDGENVLPGMFGSGWVQHFGTHESCAECQREIEEGTDGEGDDTPRDHEDDAPF